MSTLDTKQKRGNVIMKTTKWRTPECQRVAIRVIKRKGVANTTKDILAAMERAGLPRNTFAIWGLFSKGITKRVAPGYYSMN
jgi:hypothetical protein